MSRPDEKGEEVELDDLPPPTGSEQIARLLLLLAPFALGALVWLGLKLLARLDGGVP